MKKFVAVLGRQPLLSVAELESLFGDQSGVRILTPELAEFEFDATKVQAASLVTTNELSAEKIPNIQRLGGTLKLAIEIAEPIRDFLQKLPMEGKITLGLSDFTRSTSAYRAQGEALKLKRFLSKAGHNVRVIPNKTAILSSATSFHNQLWKANKLELLKLGNKYYRVVAVQNIDNYVRRDRARPARDAKVGMLPPKLAQILINLCGDLPAGARLLDPFCGTGVVLQEASLMDYIPYGTDLSERMVEYSQQNLTWLSNAGGQGPFAEARRVSPPSRVPRANPPRESGPSAKSSCLPATIDYAEFEVGDATSFQWQPPIDAVACEAFLGQPMSQPPAEIKLKQEKQECRRIITGFLRNLGEQAPSGTPVVMAIPAWLRPNGQYERLNILDEIQNLSYNVKSFKNLGQKDLLYRRTGQVVAREIIVLRKK